MTQAGTPPEGVQKTPENIGWKTEIPMSLRDHEAFATYGSKDELWKGHIEAVNKAKGLEGKLAGSIPKLTKSATAEEISQYRKAMDIPETSDGYVLQRPENLSHDENLEKWFMSEAHKINLSKEQAANLYKSWNALAVETLEKGRDICIDVLKEKWGQEFNVNVELAKRAAKQFGGEPLLQYFEASGLGNDPVMFETFLSIGKAMNEDSSIGSSQAPVGGPPEGEFDYPSMKK